MLLLPPAASIERTLAARAVGTFANIVLDVGGQRYFAVLDSGVERVGEYGQFIESRDRLTFDKKAAPALAPGLALTADATYYTAPELAAMPRTGWTLDAEASDDGYVSEWWTR